MQVGSATATAGELVRGWLDVTDLPTGTAERLPVVVARGEDPGPTLWVTGGVHGDEATGVAVAQDVMREDLPDRLSGTVVCIPVVNPAGLRRNQRRSYYGDDDPNRYFPDPEKESSRPPKVQERINRRVYEEIIDSADALVDCHTATTNSYPFAIRDRVLHGEHRDREDAENLADRLAGLVDAFGFPVLTEYPAEEYLEMNLQRSTAGAVCNSAGIPAFTAEFGGHSVVTDRIRVAGVAGIYGVMDQMGMLDGWPDDLPQPGAFEAPVGYPTRRYRGPRTDTAGLVRHRVEAGDVVEEGEVVADVVSANGEKLDTVASDFDGYVIGAREGIAVYEGDPVLTMAVRDDGGLVAARDATASDDGNAE